MNFQRGKVREEPEINLIPLIDILLVILIFLMVTTSYAKLSELKIDLPQANGEQNTLPIAKRQIDVAVDASGRYAINGQPTPFKDAAQFAAALRQAAGEESEPVIVISADAKAAHQTVINVMEAARSAGYGRITFTTQKQPD